MEPDFTFTNHSNVDVLFALTHSYRGIEKSELSMKLDLSFSETGGGIEAEKSFFVAYWDSLLKGGLQLVSKGASVSISLGSHAKCDRFLTILKDGVLGEDATADFVSSCIIANDVRLDLSNDTGQRIVITQKFDLQLTNMSFRCFGKLDDTARTGKLTFTNNAPDAEFLIGVSSTNKELITVDGSTSIALSNQGGLSFERARSLAFANALLKDGLIFLPAKTAYDFIIPHFKKDCSASNRNKFWVTVLRVMKHGGKLDLHIIYKDVLFSFKPHGKKRCRQKNLSGSFTFASAREHEIKGLDQHFRMQE
jgi:hypothetical protein